MVSLFLVTLKVDFIILIPNIIIPRHIKIVKHFMNVIIFKQESNNNIPVVRIYALLILFFWNNKFPNDGKIRKNVHQPGNNRLYFGNTNKKIYVVIA